MIVTIIGWYGTETSGDRAILDGILNVLNEIDEKAEVQLGSLFPFYSERTLWEEKSVFKKSAPFIDIKIFNIRNKSELKKAIKRSTILILGGGPLMDLEELYLIDSAFYIAQKNNVPSVVMGCGIGPLNNERYQKLVEKILNRAARISLRDKLSGITLEKLWPNQFEYECLGDPAVISIENFLKTSYLKRENYLAVNFRDFPGAQYGEKSWIDSHIIRDMLNNISAEYEKIILVPMHTFYIGNDDRKFLTKIQMGSCNERMQVIHNPLNLHELYQIFLNASACMGMRYHSIVMQTILNGNNIIIDYTDPNTGKIAGFIDMINGKHFYEDKRVCLNTHVNGKLKKIEDVLYRKQRFEYKISEMRSEYVKFLQSI